MLKIVLINISYIQVLKTEKDKEEARHEEELTEKLEAHSRELQDLGNIIIYNLYDFTLCKKHQLQNFLRIIIIFEVFLVMLSL